MRLVVITPVGPGHQELAKDAIESVQAAQNHQGCVFSSVRHVVIDDGNGELGRGRARNLGMVEDCDWYFFLDADDVMASDALCIRNFDRQQAQAVFGAVAFRDTAKSAQNIYPCGWRELARHGACGTLSMGFFCRTEVARALKFDETMDAGEDFDFYLRLDSFAKLDRVLVKIGYHLPSASGPRGYVKIDWTGICNGLITAAIQRNPNKYDFGGDAVLAQAGDSRPLAGNLSQPLPA